MINPETLDLSTLPSVALESKSDLPTQSAIYFAIDPQGVVQYVGRSANLNNRWVQHNKLKELESIGGIRISYLSLDCDLLTDVEKALIRWFNPPLNKILTTPERKYYTLRLCPELKNRVDHWAVERGCRPCDVINDLIADGLEAAIAKSDEVAA